MSAWKYLSSGFWQRVTLPLLGRVPVNAVALAGFGVAGFDQPLLWAAGGAWGTLWMLGTAGRAGYRRRVDQTEKRQAWRSVEERRLQLCQQLPDAERLRHHRVRAASQELQAANPASTGQPDPAVELFTWLHLKLLLARQRVRETEQTGNAPPGSVSPQRPDPDAPRLQAQAAVEMTDPARARLADESIGLIAPRLGLHDPLLPPLQAIDAALARIEHELAAAASGRTEGGLRPAPAAALVQIAEAETARLSGSLGSHRESESLDAEIRRLTETAPD